MHARHKIFLYACLIICYTTMKVILNLFAITNMPLLSQKIAFWRKWSTANLFSGIKKKYHFCILNLMVPYGHRSPHLFFKSLLPTTLSQPLNFDYTQHSQSRSEFLFFKLNTSANLLYAVLWYNPNEDKEEWFARVLDKYMLSMEDEWILHHVCKFLISNHFPVIFLTYLLLAVFVKFC